MDDSCLLKCSKPRSRSFGNGEKKKKTLKTLSFTSELQIDKNFSEKILVLQDQLKSFILQPSFFDGCTIKKIAEGGFANVYKMNDNYCIKQLKPFRHSRKRDVYFFLKEILFLATIQTRKHPNILNFVGCNLNYNIFEFNPLSSNEDDSPNGGSCTCNIEEKYLTTQNSLFFVTEYCDNETLYSFIHHRHPIKPIETEDLSASTSSEFSTPDTIEQENCSTLFSSLPPTASPCICCCAEKAMRREASTNDVTGICSQSRFGKLPKKQKLRIAWQVAESLRFLHEMNFVHCDFKSLNVLLTSNLTPKLADFTSIQEVMHPDDRLQANGFSGSILWLSPETIEKNYFSMRSDVFSFGITLLEMLSLKKPYFPMNTLEALEFKKSKGQLVVNKEDCLGDEILCQLIRSCCDNEEKKRPSAAECTVILKSLYEQELQREEDDELFLQGK